MDSYFIDDRAGLGVNGLDVGRDAIAADFRDNGAGLGGDLLHVGGNMAI